MGIILKQHQGKWKIEIEHEEWEFMTKTDFDKALKDILEIKDKNGRIRY